MVAWQKNTYAINFIKAQEGFDGAIYLDSGGKKTVGWGHLLTKKEAAIYSVGDELSIGMLNNFFLNDYNHARNTVHHYCDPVNNYIEAAFIDFVFNLGSGNFSTSSLLRYFNNKEYNACGDEFGRWINVCGIPSNGLRKRRYREQAIYLRGVSKIKGGWQGLMNWAA